MKQHHRFLTLIAAASLLALAQLSAFAQTPPTISYQGILQNNGVAMNGTDTLKILIYDVETGGSPLYSETQTVSVVNGIYNLSIGSVTPLLPTLDFTKQYYLAVSVDGGSELSPRALVSFAPYAFRALNADTASYANNAANAATAARATIANGLSGPFVTSVNGLSTTLTLTGTNGITIANSNGNIAIGNSGVQSVNTAGGKLTLVGAGGTTITDTGTTITIHSQTFTGGTGIQAVQNSDSSITITNGSGPIATVSLGHQNASSGQVLSWNGTAWKPATLSSSSGPDSIKDLQDARDDGSSVYLGAGSGVNNSGKNHNVALGIGALHAITTGYDNTALGDSALAHDTLGIFNVAIGMNALENFNYTGGAGPLVVENVAVGSDALQNLVTGGGNTAIGHQAMGLTVTAGSNTACGFEAMYNSGSVSSPSGPIHNSAFGFQALYENFGSDNSGFGSQTLYNNTGSFNAAVGSDALVANRTGSSNSALGVGSMYNNDSGSFNVAVGYWALPNSWERSHLVAIGDSSLYRDGFSRSLNNVATLDSGTANTAVGDLSLFSNSTGSYNTGVGYHVLFSDSIGYRNTALGYTALNQNATGNDNTAIGSSAGPNTTNLNNTITLGSGAVATASNEVVIGNTNVTSLYCAGAYAATTANAANMVVSSTGQIMRSTSSARYKTDIHDLDINTDKLYDLRPVSYISKIDGKPYFGLVAEDVAKVIPDLAEYARAKDVVPGSTSDELIPDAVKYPMLSVLLLEELKKEHAKEESQEKIIADLAKRVEALETEQNGRTH